MLVAVAAQRLHGRGQLLARQQVVKRKAVVHELHAAARVARHVVLDAPAHAARAVDARQLHARAAAALAQHPARAAAAPVSARHAQGGGSALALARLTDGMPPMRARHRVLSTWWQAALPQVFSQAPVLLAEGQALREPNLAARGHAQRPGSAHALAGAVTMLPCFATAPNETARTLDQAGPLQAVALSTAAGHNPVDPTSLASSLYMLARQTWPLQGRCRARLKMLVYSSA